MRRASVFVVLLLHSVFLLPVASFAGNLTNPALSIPTGKSSIGLEYSSGSSKYKPGDSGWSAITVDTNQVYLKASYGLYEGTEIYLKAGMADAKSEKAFADDSAFSDSQKFSGVVGVKRSYEMAPKIRLGGALQYAFFSSYADEKSYTYLGLPVTEKLKIKNPSELNAALAASYIGESFAPYGGLVASWRNFDAEDAGTVSGIPFTASTKYKEDDLIGILAGVDILRGNLRGNIEVQIFKETSFAGSISYLF